MVQEEIRRIATHVCAYMENFVKPDGQLVAQDELRQVDFHSKWLLGGYNFNLTGKGVDIILI